MCRCVRPERKTTTWSTAVHEEKKGVTNTKASPPIAKYASSKRKIIRVRGVGMGVVSVSRAVRKCGWFDEETNVYILRKDRAPHETALIETKINITAKGSQEKQKRIPSRP